MLSLDGQGGNVELPPNIFSTLSEATVEAWVRFGAKDETRFYSYGGYAGDLCLGRSFTNERQIQFFINSAATGGKFDELAVPDDIRIGQWYHVAAVCSTNGMRLHLNGFLVATNDAAKCFNSTITGPHNIGLRHPFERLPSFTGQVDEFRVWKVARSAEQIRQTMNRGLTGTEPGLAALWNFDDPHQPGRDASTNAHHGRLLSGARTVEMSLPGEGTLAENKLLDLDGSDGTYVELPPNLLNHLTNLTVEGWVRWRSPGFWARFFDFGKANVRCLLITQVERTRGLRVETWAEGIGVATPISEDVVRSDRWFHLAVSVDAQGTSVYLNGALVVTNNAKPGFSPTNTDNRSFLGRNVWKLEVGSNVTDLNGQLDEFRIWSIARSREQIVATMNERLTGREPGLFGLWNFDRVVGSQVLDATTNAHHGQLHGAATCVAGEALTTSTRSLTVVMSGRATTPAGAALGGADVWLEAGDRIVARTTANATGVYRLLFSGDPGEYDLCAQGGDVGGRRAITLSEGGLRTEDLSCAPNVNFSGTLAAFGQGNYLAAVIVQAVRVRADGVRQVARTVHTDAGGHFTIKNLRPGDYQLRHQTATGFEPFEKGRIYRVGERFSQSGLNVQMGPFKRGLWRSFNTGGSQSTQGFQGASQADDPAAVFLESSGLVWASSSMGAVRYDGAEIAFLNVRQNGLVDDRVRSLFRAADGAMWFGTRGGLTRWDGQARNFTATNGLIPGAIRPMAQTPDGAMWFGGDNGLCRYDGRAFTRFTTADGLPSATVNQIAVTKGGTVWIATRGGLCRYEAGRFVPMAADTIVEANAVMVAGDGSVWCGTPSGAIQLRAEKPANLPGGARGQGDEAQPALGGAVGGAAGMDQTLLARLTTSEGLIVDNVTAIHEMADGTLWFGTEAGLSRYDGTNFINYVVQDGLVHNGIASLSSSADGVLWVGCLNGQLCYYDPRTFWHYGLADGLVAPGLGPGSVDQKGTVWMGNWFPGSGAHTALYSVGVSGVTNHAPPSETAWINAVRAAPDGTVWAATQAGLMRCKDNAVSVFTTTHGLLRDDCSDVVWDASGTLYIPHFDGGITRYDGARFEPMPLSSGTWPNRIPRLRIYGTNEFWLCGLQGLWRYDGAGITAYTNGLAANGAFLDVHKDKEGAYWVGTAGGLVRFDGQRFGSVHTAAKDRLSDNTVWQVFRDSKGLLWFAGWGEAGAGGVTRWDGQVWSTLSVPDGLSDGSIRWIGEGPNGVYWLSTGNGLTRYEPSTRKPGSPRLEIAAAEDYGDREDLPAIHIGQRVSFKCNVTDFRTRPETRRFRWLVAPGTFTAAALPAAEWTEGSSATQFEWVPNAPGDYMVAVQYVDRDFNYSDPTIRRLQIVLPWTQNAWIVAPAGAAVLGLFGSSVFFGSRYVSKRREAERLRAQMFEQERRTRIALENKNVQLERARDIAEAANRTKSVFLANMSHELRTPLTAIMGFTEILQDEARAEGRPEQEEDLDRIYDSAKHLLGLINGILDLSKIEAQKMELHLEEFSLKTLVEEVTSMLRPLVAKKENQLLVACPGDLGDMYADLSKVRQALLNLLGNANKFTEKGTVTLRVRRKAANVTFEIQDTGIGMSEEQLGKLFQAFTQAESSTARKYGGTGLGLTITKHFAEMMKGALTVASELGRGSTFTLTLPARVEAPSAPEPTGLPGDERPAELGRCLLVIDDDPHVHRLIERSLQPEGFTVRGALDGKAGLKLARELRPALITLDVMMPHTDGWCVLSALKADPDLCNIPVVMLSIIGEKELGFALGASDYLIKPVERIRLLEVLRRYLPEPRGQHVLVVEDDANLRELLRRMLNAEHLEVVEAENGAVGIAKLKERLPGLVLLDLMMPVMDGFAVLAELQRTPAWRGIPVVVVTAKELSEADRMRILCESDAIIHKGALSKEDLVREVRQLIRHYGPSQPTHSS